MNDFAKILDAIDVFGRKKTTTGWILIMIYAAYILLLDLSILLRFIVEGNTAGVWFFAFFTLFFVGGLIFQLFNKPPKLFMVIHVPTGIPILPEPITEDAAKLQVQGLRKDTFTYIPASDFLKMKETAR